MNSCLFGPDCSLFICTSENHTLYPGVLVYMYIICILEPSNISSSLLVVNPSHLVFSQTVDGHPLLVDGAFISHEDFNFSSGNQTGLGQFSNIQYNNTDKGSVPVRLTSLFFPPVQGDASECSPDLPYLEVKSGFKSSALCGLPSESVLIRGVTEKLTMQVMEGIPDTKGFLIRYQGESTLRTVSSP